MRLSFECSQCPNETKPLIFFQHLCFMFTDLAIYYGRTLSDASMLYFADVFFIFFMPALVGQTAERIFTKLSHVVDSRCYLRTY